MKRRNKERRRVENTNVKISGFFIGRQVQTHIDCEGIGYRNSSLPYIQPGDINSMNGHLNPSHRNPIETHTNDPRRIPVSFHTRYGPSNILNCSRTNSCSHHSSSSYILTHEPASHGYLVTKVEQTRSVLGMVSAADIDKMLSNVRM